MRLHDTVKPTLSPWLLASAALVAVLVIMGADARVKPLPKAELAEAETLYRHGILPDGRPLRGERKGGEAVEAQAAACANCHRRSGFGVEEGRIVIPPINGKYLFRESSTDAAAMAHPGSEATAPRRRSRYTSETLARAIREGIDPDGRTLDYLMPRFALDDASIQLLIAYLTELSAPPAPRALTDIRLAAAKAFSPVSCPRGVLLEADVMAQRLAAAAPAAAPGAPGESAARNEAHAPDATSGRIVQIFRSDDIGAAAAHALAADLAPNVTQVALEELKAKSPAGELARLVREAKSADALVLWLRPADLKTLPQPATLPDTVLVSGLMGGLEQAPLPSSWRATTRLTYPFALPSQRLIAMNYPLGWFRIQQIAVTDERTQTNTYLACSILAEAASTMLDNFVPDYLVERVEVELSHRIINGYYPRLGLAPGQRFASKGAYLVRFSEPTGTRIVADGDWVVP